ncbi:MAG: hypothetical protein M3430_04690 [Acidobacteriota bacterium]|nr:hypothetical protein [Acidobacteriota bacterium]
MIDKDVEKVLREIRERVRAEALNGVAPPDGTSEHIARPAPAEGALDRFEMNLSVLARAWDKLPPIGSYRQGFLRRLELWLKHGIKRATHWFTWEQLNFNSATHNTLRETLIALRAHEEKLTAVEETYEAKLAVMAENQEKELKALREEIATLASLVFVEKEIAELQFQLRETGERILDEQRVSFKQMKFETSESFASSDRARRQAEMRLDEFARQVQELRRAATGGEQPSSIASTSAAFRNP